MIIEGNLISGIDFGGRQAREQEQIAFKMRELGRATIANDPLVWVDMDGNVYSTQATDTAPSEYSAPDKDQT